MTTDENSLVMTTTQSLAPSPWPSQGRMILFRAAVVALGLGSVLALINQGAAIFGPEDLQVLPLALVFVTPFVVVTLSQILAIRRATKDVQTGVGVPPREERFLSTALSHGILLRALGLALFVGGFNTVLVLTVTVYQVGELGALPWALMMQSFSLPVVFGVLSQTLTYRRSVMAIFPDGETSGESHKSTVMAAQSV